MDLYAASLDGDSTMSRVNTDHNYDPDFGNCYPDVDGVFQVEVSSPRGEKKKPHEWTFFILMPRLVDDEDSVALVEKVCNDLLRTSDSYKVFTFDIENFDQDKLKYIPCACFDSRKPEEFFWLNPPRYLWN